MTRTKSKAVPPGVEVGDEHTPGLPAMVEAHDKLNRQLAVIDQQFGGGEFEITVYNRERVINETRFFLGQSSQAMLEAGKRLILMKEHEPHGEWMQCLEKLNLDWSVAARMMKASLKFSDTKLATSPTLSKSKLIELMMLDDEEIHALDVGGTVAGLTLDEIDKMSARELRAALREARENEKAKDQVLADKNAKIDDLATQLEKRKKKSRIETPTPDEEGAQLREEVGLFAFEAEVAILGKLTKGFEALAAHAETNNCTHEEFMSGCLAQIERALLGLRSRFDVKAVPDGQERPLWTRDDVDTDAIVSEALRNAKEVAGHA